MNVEGRVMQYARAETVKKFIVALNAIHRYSTNQKTHTDKYHPELAVIEPKK